MRPAGSNIVYRSLRDDCCADVGHPKQDQRWGVLVEEGNEFRRVIWEGFEMVRASSIHRDNEILTAMCGDG